jgi:purine-nucleoside phosphorylase
VPDVVVTLGSGLADLVDAVDDLVEVPFTDLPSLPAAGAPGHGGGRFVFGRLDDVPVLLQAGRIHAYEGVAPEAVVAPVRIVAALGVRALLLTNAAGGIRPGLEPGDLVLLDDQIDLTFRRPLAGAVREGEMRFPDMSVPFDPVLRGVLREVARDQGMELAEGVYAAVHGPSYETRAEVRMLARLGADLVGMSTVGEVAAARALGLPTAAVSLVTNRATGLAARPLSHEEVLETGRRAGAGMIRLVRGLLGRLSGFGGQSTSAK